MSAGAIYLILQICQVLAIHYRAHPELWHCNYVLTAPFPVSQDLT